MQALGIDLKIELAHISLPALYRHKPLYHVALYHELGHFIDTHYKITETTLLQHPPPTQTGVDPAVIQQVELRHRMEFFADLFAASYTGEGIYKFLENFAPGQPASPTHPATDIRLRNINKFLNGKANNILSVFQAALKVRSLPELVSRFESLDIEIPFAEIRPVNIVSPNQIHGILDAGWTFLGQVIGNRIEQWKDLDGLQAERIVNDLIEKSVRNWMIIEKWNNATA
ncbi:MAG: hypothetical protein AB2598_21100 [Candidatus Thiodiazotropha sp.]